MEKPQGSEKWVVTNLDGSYHKHVKLGGYQESKQEQLIREAPEINEAKITANLRSEAIAKAHEENIEASSKLTSAINRLCDTLVDIERLLSVYVQGREGGV